MILNKTRPKLNFFDWIFYQLEVTINKKNIHLLPQYYIYCFVIFYYKWLIAVFIA